jgi:hypothetical protein
VNIKNFHKEVYPMKQQKTFVTCLIGIAIAVFLAVPSISIGDSDDHPAKGTKRKWMSGDFHQHTFFTDGSWTMNDVIPTGYGFGLDFQANSEHGGRFGRDGFGANWTTYFPNPIIGDGAGPSAANMWRWQSLIRTSDIPGYSGAPYLGAFDWLTSVRAAYPDRITMTGMEWNVPGHEHGSTGIVAVDALPIAEFEYRFDNSDTDGTSTTITEMTMGWTGKKQNSAYTVQYLASMRPTKRPLTRSSGCRRTTRQPGGSSRPTLSAADAVESAIRDTPSLPSVI